MAGAQTADKAVIVSSAWGVRSVKNIKALIVLGVAVVAGLVAMYMADRYMKQQNESLAGAKVVVATKDLDLGTRLTPDMLQAVDWPRGSVPEGSANSVEKLVTRVVKTSVQRGEPILESKLAPVGTTGGLASVIEEGKRAMTVSVNEIIGVAGFALPGNYVDILVNTDDEKSKDPSKKVSKIVLERVLVLAVAQEASTDQTKPKVVSSVTFQVTPEEAEKIDLARSVGTLTLVLRNQVDKTPAETRGAFKQDLLRGETMAEEAKPAEAAKPRVVTRTVVKRVVEKAPAPQTQQVEVIRGTTRTTEQFKAEGQ